MFKRKKFYTYPLNELISNLMPATGLKNWHGGNKGLKKQDILKDSAGKTSSTN